MLEEIDKVVYINLAHRTDRKQQVESELLKVFPPEKIIRFDAILDKRSIGHLGCARSHIGALELAIKENWKNVLIVEDDMMWKDFDNNVKILNKLLVKNNFDVIVLGGTFVYYNEYTYHLVSCSTTVSYLVNNHYFQTLLENFKDAAERLIANPTGNSAIDQHWKHLQQKDNWYVVMPSLCVQRPSFSDIAGEHVDLTRFFL